MRIDYLAAAATGFTAGVVIPRLLALVRPLLAPAASSLQVAPPHPDWKPGDKQTPPWGDDPDSHYALDPKQMTSAYPLMISSYAPRPIAFVSTLSASGEGNLAPFSYSGVFGHDPPVVGFSVCRNRNSPDGKKDTLANIEATGEFVVNIMSDWFVEAANHCCGTFPRGADEFDESGLTRTPSLRVRPPRVAESAVHFECKLVHTYEMLNGKGEVSATLVLGQVVMVHTAKFVTEFMGEDKGKPAVNFERLRPLCRLGGDTYGVVGSTFDLPRPDRFVSKT
jgi:flavin reductase (DIM6/NTAB) family NADH-FMN oxidoreductase RutF